MPTRYEKHIGYLFLMVFYFFYGTRKIVSIITCLSMSFTFLYVTVDGTDNSQTDYQPVTKWEIEMRKIAWELDDKQRKFHNASWQDVFNQDEDALFDLPLQSETITWTVWLTRQGLWDRFRTLSFIATLGNDEQKEVQEKLFSIIERNDLDTETNIEGEIAVHGRTHMVWTFRRPTRS